MSTECGDTTTVQNTGTIQTTAAARPTPDDVADWTPEEWAWWRMGPFDGGIPGLIRRIRRILDVSQRGLAALLGVSQSMVARWETGRTSPRADRVQAMLRMAKVEITLRAQETGELVEPMRGDGARTRAGSRFPAHTDLRVKGWWIPRHLRTMTSVEEYHARARARRAKDPLIGYHNSPYWKYLERSVWGTPVDHPALHQFVAEMESRDEEWDERRRVFTQANRRRIERLRATHEEAERNQTSLNGSDAGQTTAPAP